MKDIMLRSLVGQIAGHGITLPLNREDFNLYVGKNERLCAYTLQKERRKIIELTIIFLYLQYNSVRKIHPASHHRQCAAVLGNFHLARAILLIGVG